MLAIPLLMLLALLGIIRLTETTSPHALGVQTYITKSNVNFGFVSFFLSLEAGSSPFSFWVLFSLIAFFSFFSTDQSLELPYSLAA